MEFQDWIDIVEKTPNGRKSFNKMIKYGKKDIADTRALWFQLEEHFEPKFNVGMWKHHGKELACKNCASINIIKDGPRTQNNTRYQQFWCKTCDKYAGRARLNQFNEVVGRII